MSKILNVSEAASIGLHAMVVLAKKPGQLVSAREIAHELSVSLNHLAKVLQRLVKTGLVISVKGAKGGFVLDKSAGKTTFLQIYEAIEGEMHCSDCLFDKKVCQGEKCVMVDVVQTCNRIFLQYLRDTRLAKFMKKG